MPIFSNTGSETFFRYQIFPIPVPRLFPGTKFFRYRFQHHKKIKNSRYRYVTLWLWCTSKDQTNDFLNFHTAQLGSTQKDLRDPPLPLKIWQNSGHYNFFCQILSLKSIPGKSIQLHLWHSVIIFDPNPNQYYMINATCIKIPTVKQTMQLKCFPPIRLVLSAINWANTWKWQAHNSPKVRCALQLHDSSNCTKKIDMAQWCTLF